MAEINSPGGGGGGPLSAEDQIFCDRPEALNSTLLYAHGPTVLTNPKHCSVNFLSTQS